MNKIIINIFSLGIVQIANYILPLITVPYLVWVLGVENFGKISIANAIIAYFVLVTDYGFSLSATKKIAMNKDDLQKIIEITNAVLQIKFIILILSAGLLFCLTKTVPFIHENRTLYWLTFSAIIGNICFATWFFQGMESMHYITVLHLLSRIFFTMMIFLFVNAPSDILLVPLLNSSGFILIGFISVYLMVKKFNFQLEIQSITSLKNELKDGFNIFLSNLGKSSYINAIYVFIGVFGTETEAGQYAIADKSLQAVKGANIPITQAFYPAIAKYVLSDVHQANRLRTIAFIPLNAVMVAVTGMLFFYNEQLIEFVFGVGHQKSADLLKIMSPVPFLVGISAFTCTLSLLVGGHSIEYRNTYLWASLTALILSLLLVYTLKSQGAAIVVVISELLVVTLSLFYLQKLKRH